MSVLKICEENVEVEVGRREKIMYCPKCLLEEHRRHGIKTRVIDSRLQPNQIVRRRRECPLCDYRFTTWESPMTIDVRETLLKRPQRELSKIRQTAQGIIDRINKND